MEKMKGFLSRSWKKMLLCICTVGALLVSLIGGLPILFPPTPSTGDATQWATLTSLAADGSLRHNNATYATAWSATAALTNYNTSLQAAIGQQLVSAQYYISRGFILFNLTSFVYATANITSVILSFAFYVTSSFNNTVDIYQPESAYAVPSNPLALTDYDQTNFNSGTYLGTLNCTTGTTTTNTYYNVTLTPLTGIFNFSQGYANFILRTNNEVQQRVPTDASVNQTTIYYNENVTFAPKLYVQYHTDPTASGTNNQFRDPFQRKTFYTSTGYRTWVAFNNASSYSSPEAASAWFVLTSTTDNTNFVDPFAIGNIGIGVGEQASLYYDVTNNYVDFIYQKYGSLDVAYRRGTPNGTDGTIVLTDETIIVDGNETLVPVMPSIVTDSNGYPYACISITTTMSPVWLYKNAWNNGSWLTSWNYNFTQTAATGKAGRAVPLRLLNGKVGVLHNKNGDYVYYSQWNSSSGTPEVFNETASVNTCYHGDFMSGVTVLDNVHLSYLFVDGTNNGWLFYRIRNGTSGTWNTEVLITSGLANTDGAVMNWDKTDDSTRIFWANDANDHVYYKQHFNNGTLSNAIDFYTSTEQISTNRTTHVSYETNGGENITVAFQVGLEAPFHVRTLHLQINGTALVAGWNGFMAVAQDAGHSLGEMNASLNYDYINWTVITVDYLNGTQWSLIYGTSYNSEYLITESSKLWIYCTDAIATWTHTYP